MIQKQKTSLLIGLFFFLTRGSGLKPSSHQYFFYIFQGGAYDLPHPMLDPPLHRWPWTVLGPYIAVGPGKS